MTDAVIVAYGRSPIGRARKGSLVDVRPDDLAAQVVPKVLDQLPALDPPDTYNPKLVPGNTEEYPDIYIAMGQTAENVAAREKISREEQDRYAVKSQTAAVKARDDGFFEREIIPVPLPNGQIFTKDDGPRPGTTVEVLATLQPAFRENGTVTAGNSCPLNDGAAAVVVMSDRRPKE